MDRKQILVLHSLLLAIISVSFSAPVQLQTLLLTPLPKTLKTRTLSWPTQIQSSEPDSTLTLHLHHVDNLHHPVNSTPESLFNLRLHRDAARVKTLSSVAAGRFRSSVISGLAQGSGEYFTRIGLGTPPKPSYMILDTGSDVVWLQCSPCRKCYRQTGPLFDPKKSMSFKGVKCGNPLCRQSDSAQCNNRNECLYQVSYGDGSFTSGQLSTETLTFSHTKVQNIAFGCGHDNEGSFVAAAGLLGLGRGKLAFPTQAVGQFGKKFSYCLPASAKSSSIMFGESAISKNSLFTPLLTNPMIDTFYYVELIGISVGGARVSGVKASYFKLDPTGNRGVIVDSGTSVTRLIQPAYKALKNAFLGAGASKLKRASGISIFDTCFDLSGKTEVRVPTVVLHLKGADLSLPPTNYLIPVDSHGKFCFAFAGTMDGLSIIGNIQQQGFRVGFDLANKRVGFAPKGCT